jgi:hypothetical protein
MGRPRGKENRDKKKFIYYTQREIQQLEKEFAKSSCQTLTQYIRNLSLKSPFLVHRNRAFDQFVEEVLLLRKEMHDFREQTRLTTENEIRITRLHEEIKNSINKLIDLCMQK